MFGRQANTSSERLVMPYSIFWNRHGLREPKSSCTVAQQMATVRRVNSKPIDYIRRQRTDEARKSCKSEVGCGESGGVVVG